MIQEEISNQQRNQIILSQKTFPFHIDSETDRETQHKK